ncbi:hypothetical protein ES703_100520 [subsurface metagenome]
MTTSLTREQMLERFQHRQSEFSEAVGQRIKPELPFTVESYEDLAEQCTHVIRAFLEVVFTEDNN